MRKTTTMMTATTVNGINHPLRCNVWFFVNLRLTVRSFRCISCSTAAALNVSAWRDGPATFSVTYNLLISLGTATVSAEDRRGDWSMPATTQILISGSDTSRNHSLTKLQITILVSYITQSTHMHFYYAR